MGTVPKEVENVIKGIGMDLIELYRIQKNIANQTRLIERVLTEKEQEKFNTFEKERRKTEFLAGRFAAKEAFAKAVGCGIGKLSFQDIEITNEASGEPQLTATGYECDRIFVSITHTREYAAAQVVIEET